MVSRRSIDIEGVAHGAPIPFGCRVGTMIFSSAVMGRDAKTGELPADGERQAALMFENLRTFLKQAGGSSDGIGHMTVFLTDNKYRDALNTEWLKMFPDEHNRPARHVQILGLPGGMLMQCEVIAVAD